MADRNDKNLLDDTGLEMVNALRRILTALSGTETHAVRINYRDNNFNLLDKTGKLLVESLTSIAETLEQGGSTGGVVLPASAERDGLMSAADKVKLDAFSAAGVYVSQNMLDALTGVRIVDSEDALPEGTEGQLVLVASDGVLNLYDGTTWLALTGGIGEQDVLRIIGEETAHAAHAGQEEQGS